MTDNISLGMVERAKSLLDEAWQIMKEEDPHDVAYSELRLIAKDIDRWQEEQRDKGSSG